MPEVSWPEALVEELAGRRAVIVTGAGLSATAAARGNEHLHPPAWGELLTQLGRSSLTPEDFGRLQSNVDNKKFLDAAEILKSNADQASFDSTLRRLLVTPKFLPSSAHWDVMQLDAKVVITINYDNIYEAVCREADQDEYIFVNYDDKQLVNYMRSPRRVVLRLHGTVETPARTVLSMSEYHKMKSSNQHVYEMVKALLLTNTVLFLGCGFGGDPDLDLLLQENSFALESAYPHYALVPAGSALPEVRAGQSGVMNVKFLEYDCPILDSGITDHSAFLRATADLSRRVLDQRSLLV